MAQFTYLVDNLDNLLPYPLPTDTPVEVPDPEWADEALDFVEEEVGRFDWENNWRLLKQHHNMAERVQNWLDRYGISGDADGIVKYIDQLTLNRSGKRWR